MFAASRVEGLRPLKLDTEDEQSNESKSFLKNTDFRVNSHDSIRNWMNQFLGKSVSVATEYTRANNREYKSRTGAN